MAVLIALFEVPQQCYAGLMASLLEMTEAELIDMLETVDADTNPELAQAILTELERRHLDS